MRLVWGRCDTRDERLAQEVYNRAMLQAVLNLPVDLG